MKRMKSIGKKEVNSKENENSQNSKINLDNKSYYYN